MKTNFFLVMFMCFISKSDRVIVQDTKESPKWIWTKSPVKTLYFRKTFEIDADVNYATLFITCDDRFTLYVNGEQIGDGSEWSILHEFNLKRYLTKGKNVVAVLGLNDGGPAGLLADLTITFTNDKKLRLLSDKSWKINAGEVTGWSSKDFVDSEWEQAAEIGDLGCGPWNLPQKLESRMISVHDLQDVDRSGNPDAPFSPDPAVRFKWSAPKNGLISDHQKMSIRPVHASGLDDSFEKIGTLCTDQVEATIKKPGRIFLDFGRVLAGWVEIECEAGDDQANITIQVGEAKTPQSTFPTIAKSKGKHTIYRILPTGGYTGFRFAWIDIKKLASPLKLIRAEAIWRLYPVNYEGSFDSSDPLLTKIWCAGAYTARLCLDSNQMGSILRPERGDRYGWMGDDRVSFLTIFNAFGTYELTRRSLGSYVKPGQKPILINNIPGYTLDWVIALVNYYLYTGNEKELKSRIPDIETILTQYNAPKDPGNWLFTDWEAGLWTSGTRYGKTLPETLHAFHAKFVQAAKSAAWALDKIGEKERAVKYKTMAEDRMTFVKKDKSWHNSMGVHALTNAVLADIVDDQEWAKIRDKILEKPSTITPYFSFFILQALSEKGESTKALETVRNYWGGMIKLEATSFWECFRTEWTKSLKPLDQPSNVPPENGSFFVSLCHPWSSGVTAWLSMEVLGVKPKEPGFSHCEITPFIGDLEWTKGTVPTPHGPIQVSWKRTGDDFALEFSAPKGVEKITVGVPDGKTITVNTKSTSPVRKKDKTAYLDLQGSGKYTVQSKN